MGLYKIYQYLPWNSSFNFSMKPVLTTPIFTDLTEWKNNFSHLPGLELEVTMTFKMEPDVGNPKSTFFYWQRDTGSTKRGCYKSLTIGNGIMVYRNPLIPHIDTFFHKNNLELAWLKTLLFSRTMIYHWQTIRSFTKVCILIYMLFSNPGGYSRNAQKKVNHIQVKMNHKLPVHRQFWVKSLHGSILSVWI